MATDLRTALALPPGPVDLASIDTRATTGFDGGKADAPAAMAALDARLDEAQERLYAGGQTGDRRRVLVVLQGMDTAGKGGTLRHAAGMLDPQALSITSFKAPTAEELRHDFLWRVRRRVPGPGMIGIFDRSHYEDVLIARVRGLAGPDEIERRYAAINEFEAELAEDGVAVLKCFLHISYDRQGERLAARLDDPAKHWKFNPADIDERGRWHEYQQAYATAIERCSTQLAPWHVVPSDRKWYRNWAVAHLLCEHLESLDLAWPVADFDVAEQQARLAAT